MGNSWADHGTPLYPQKLALTSPIGGDRCVGIVRSRTKATEFSLVLNRFFGEIIHILNSDIFCENVSNHVISTKFAGLRKNYDLNSGHESLNQFRCKFSMEGRTWETYVEANIGGSNQNGLRKNAVQRWW